MLFALSTHLFHNEKLSRAHLELAAAKGFSQVEIFATRSHVDYHNTHAVDEVASWLRSLRLEAFSLHAPICDRFKDGKWGRAFSNASTSSTERQEAINETSLAIDAAKRLGAEIVVLHVGLPNEQATANGVNDPASASRSLEVIAEQATKVGVRLALEVMPNALATAGALLAAI